ncbi:MAG: PAS domain-containing protein [Pseudomonadota bacterium]
MFGRPETALHDHWTDLRALSTVPRRSDIMPSALGAALEHLILLDKATPMAATLRIGGLRVCELLGAEVRGHRLADLFEAESRPHVEAMVAGCLTQPALADLSGRALLKNGRDVRLRMILRPLLDLKGSVSRVIGTLVVDAELTELSHAVLTASDVNLCPIETGWTAYKPRRFSAVRAAPGPSARPVLRAIEGGAQTQGNRASNKPMLRLVEPVT